MRICTNWALRSLPFLAILGWLLLDTVPRFFQGDSVSYLMTGFNNWLPPDRSWVFGFASAFILRHGHGPVLFILLQTLLLTLIVCASRLLLGPAACRRPVLLVLVGCTCLDPLIEIYTRFFMSDFVAFGAFILFLVGYRAALKQDGARSIAVAGLLLMFTAGAVAVFMRVAYSLIIEATSFLILVAFCTRLRGRQWLPALLGVAIPFLLIGCVIASNGVVFSKQFPGEHFVTKLSGVFLAGVFAPAVSEADFAKADIPITSAEFAKLNLGDYGKRVRQVWNKDPDDLQQFLKDKLGVRQDYDARVDSAATALVKAAAIRAPWGILKVYLVSARLYLEPGQWQRQTYGEMGLSQALPAYFVSYFNDISVMKITPDITAVKSALIRAYQALAPFYPAQIILGLIALITLLVREGRNDVVIILGAALIADLVTVPVYSNYLIARYILAALFINYLLIGLAMASICGGRIYSKAGTAR
jgi:hypothetical protein